MLEAWIKILGSTQEKMSLMVSIQSLICSSPITKPQNNPTQSAASWMLNKADKVVGGNASDGPAPVELLLLLENLAESSLRLFTPQQPIEWKKTPHRCVLSIFLTLFKDNDLL